VGCRGCCFALCMGWGVGFVSLPGCRVVCLRALEDDCGGGPCGWSVFRLESCVVGGHWLMLGGPSGVHARRRRPGDRFVPSAVRAPSWFLVFRLAIICVIPLCSLSESRESESGLLLVVHRSEGRAGLVDGRFVFLLIPAFWTQRGPSAGRRTCPRGLLAVSVFGGV